MTLPRTSSARFRTECFLPTIRPTAWSGASQSRLVAIAVVCMSADVLIGSVTGGMVPSFGFGIRIGYAVWVCGAPGADGEPRWAVLNIDNQGGGKQGNIYCNGSTDLSYALGLIWTGTQLSD